jgi:hypothetical protein
MKISYKNTKEIKEKNQDIILKLQNIIEHIIRNKDLTEVIKVLIFLLKKYLPRNFTNKLDKGTTT